jgi:P-type E1-E2 ATPase
VAERRSEHFLAKAILEEAERHHLSLDDPEKFQSKPGFGVIAEHNGERILVGNSKLMEENGVSIEGRARSLVATESALGQTVVLVARDSEVWGVISVADTPRPEVKLSILRMRDAGVNRVVMLTGDTLPTATRVADMLGVDDVFADLLPEDKVKHVEEYRKQGHRVIVVGDGVNDAPALAGANVGVAMGIAGTDVAIETAGVVLMTDDLGKVAKTMKLGQKTLSIIRQNVIFSFAVNLLGLLLSTQGFISPVLASVIHEGNALVVVFNSLRLLNGRYY